MRVCIVGGGGYFGQHVARDLQKENNHCVLVDVTFQPVPEVSLQENLTTKITGSVLDYSVLQESLHDCDACIHLAAYGMSGAPSVNRDLIFKINVEGTRLVMETCRKMGVSRFVFASSVGVIFIHDEVRNSDENQPYPKEEEYFSHYSASKARAEKEVLAANSPSFHTIALRFRGIFGKGEPRATERAAKIINRGLMFANFQKSADAVTQYSGVDNCCSAMILAEKALREKPDKCGGQAYNIVDDGTVPVIGFWNPLIKGLGRRPPFIRIPYQVVYWSAYLAELLCTYTGIPPIMNRLEVNLISITNTYSNEKAKRDLGYKPTNNHDISEIVDYYRDKFGKSTLQSDSSNLVVIGFSLLILFAVLNYFLF